MRFAMLPSLVLALCQAYACLLVHQAKTPYLFLIGDSTVAVDNGWGNGLLGYLKDPAKGTNLGVNGSTTVTWKSDNRWVNLLESVGASSGEYESIITIQFGHNDKKVMELDDFQSNLESIVSDLKEAGGTPILITPITRRNFDNGKVIESLADWAAAIAAAAGATDVKYLDLNRASIDYINAIGEDESRKYDRSKGDPTHLNPSGEKVFGRMTLDLLLQARGDLARNFRDNVALSERIRGGQYATGNE